MSDLADGTDATDATDGMPSVLTLCAYEIAGSWWARFVGWKWAQRLTAKYFAWKTKRKLARYREFRRLSLPKNTAPGSLEERFSGAVWCEECRSFHAVPRDAAHFVALNCFKPWKKWKARQGR